jgi:hypothetical protein
VTDHHSENPDCSSCHMPRGRHSPPADYRPPHSAHSLFRNESGSPRPGACLRSHSPSR